MTKFLDTLDKIGRLDKKLQEQLASVQWFCENGSIYEVYLHSLNLEETAELCCAIYEGNLVLYRVSKDPNILLRLNAQLKQAVRHSGGKQKSAHFP